MASWQSLGIITPTLGAWQLLNTPSVGAEAFRVTFMNLGLAPNGRYWRSFGVVDTIYSTDEKGSSIRIYPSVEKSVIALPIPEALKDAGFIVRYVRVRKFVKRFSGRVNEPAWSVEVEEFVS